MYSIYGYGRMIADRVRTDAYAQALRRAVKPDSVVLDIGTGTGIFALLACQFGARRVYAVEPDHAIQVAREIAASNGYAQRIEFIQGLSTQATFPEQADVIVSDLRGVLPLFQHHIPSIVDARQRLLAPGGVLIPQRDTLWVAVVEAPELYSRHVAPWGDSTYGLNMEAAQRILTNTFRKGRVTPEQLTLEPQCWATLDYATVVNPDIHGKVAWTAARGGVAHGLSVWLDATLAEGVCFSNSPSAPELIYGTAFFPWPTPVTIAAGDTVSVALHANLVGEDYVWRWETLVLGQGDPEQVKANFKQSTFLSQLLSPKRLRKRTRNFVPVLDEDGQIDRLILELMDGDKTLNDVARRVSSEFPARFGELEDALERVRKLSEKYSR